MKVFFSMAVFAAALLAQAPVPLAPPLPPNTVIATVAGVSVTIDDFKKMMENAPPQILQFIKQDPRSFLQQMFLFHELTAEGNQAKLADRSPLKEQLQAQRDWVVANAMVSEEQNTYQVTAEMIDAFYSRNQARWQQAKIRVILVGFKPGTGVADPKDLAKAAQDAFTSTHPLNQRTEDEARKLAADLVQQIRGGADFAALVKKYSDDSLSKDSGGEFPAIKATSSYPEDLKKAIFALKDGEVSDPVRQPTGFYVIRMEEKSVQPLNEVREPIIQELRQTHRDEWLRGLNSRFVPMVQKPEFFLQPDKYLGIPASPAPAQPPKP